MKIFLAVLSVLFTAATAQALPLPRSENLFQVDSGDKHYDFEGIVALSNCSGSLIQLEKASDNDHALVLTNGHCHEDGFEEPGKILSHKPSDREFDLLNPTSASSIGQLHASETIYATMTG